MRTKQRIENVEQISGLQNEGHCVIVPQFMCEDNRVVTYYTPKGEIKKLTLEEYEALNIEHTLNIDVQFV